jgi:two-component system, OmpR family, response regulator
MPPIQTVTTWRRKLARPVHGGERPPDEFPVQNGAVTIEQHASPPPTLLIVDDDRATREGLARMLADAGYRILTADSFERAVDVLKSASPDLLILDVRLGDFNGLQLIATAPRPVRAIVVTGFADTVLERDARHLGAEFLVKPITRAQLLAMIERQLPAPAPTPERRWQRKHLPTALPTQINRWPGRLLDVSYGGMRLEIDDASDTLPPSLAVALPESERRIQVEVIWSVRQHEHAWQCGAIVAEANDLVTTAWRDLVDSV